jgi:hypothetical protein
LPALRLPHLEAPCTSSSGKTLIVASIDGNVVTGATIDGKPVVVGLNAYVRKSEAEIVPAQFA